MSKTMFSIYTNVGETSSNNTITLDELVEIIQQPNDLVKKIRALSPSYVATGDKALKKTLGNLKSGLPYITAAGTFTVRKNEGLIDFTGIVQLDVDIKHPDGFGMVSEIKRRIASLPYVSIAFVSPSGCGVKALAHTTNTNPAHHGDAVRQLCDVVDALIADVVAPVASLIKGKIVDDCAKALSQPMYLSYDPDVNYNPNPEQWVHTYVEPVIIEKQIITRTGVVAERTGSHQEKILTRYVNRHKLVPGTINSSKLIGFANSVGIDREVLRDFMLGDAWEIDDVRRIDYFYNKYSDQHGSRAGEIVDNSTSEKLKPEEVQIKKESVKSNQIDLIYDKFADQWGLMADEAIVEAPIPVIIDVMNKDVEHRTIILEPGQYISQVLDGSTITRNTHIIAPTGSGKSNLKFDGPVVWVFPTTALCSQFFFKKVPTKNRNGDVVEVFVNNHAKTVWGDAPNLDGDDEFIITTYDSCANALKNLDLTRYTLIFDEFHNFTTSSSIGYKLKALRSVLPFVPCAKRVITLTATPFQHEITEFQGFDVIRVYNTETFKRNVQVLKSEESRRNDVIKKIAGRNIFSLIFLQTTDRNVLRAWENGLNAHGIEVVFVNSTTKEGDDFYEIVNNSQIRKNCVYISTSVIAEGVSIETVLESVDVYIMGSHHPFIIEQMARRFRKIKELNVFLLTNSEDGDSDVKSLAQIEIIGMSYREELKSAALRMIDAYSDSGIKLSDFNIVNFPLYEDEQGCWQVDELLIENQTYQKIAGIFSGNVNLTLEALVFEYGFDLGIDLIGSEEATFIPQNKINGDKLSIARTMALDVSFGVGQLIKNLEDEELIDLFNKSSRVVKKICLALPGIKKLGREKFEEVMNDFGAWGDKASARFITYVKLLNSGIADRETYRKEVIRICLAEGRTSDELIKLGGMVYAVEYVSATDKQKMELVMSLMLGYAAERTTKDGNKIYVFSPLENRLKHDAGLAGLNLFDY